MPLDLGRFGRVQAGYERPQDVQDRSGEILADSFARAADVVQRADAERADRVRRASMVSLTDQYKVGMALDASEVERGFNAGEMTADQVGQALKDKRAERRTAALDPVTDKRLRDELGMAFDSMDLAAQVKDAEIGRKAYAQTAGKAYDQGIGSVQILASTGDIPGALQAGNNAFLAAQSTGMFSPDVLQSKHAAGMDSALAGGLAVQIDGMGVGQLKQLRKTLGDPENMPELNKSRDNVMRMAQAKIDHINREAEQRKKQREAEAAARLGDYMRAFSSGETIAPATVADASVLGRQLAASKNPATQEKGRDLLAAIDVYNEIQDAKSLSIPEIAALAQTIDRSELSGSGDDLGRQQYRKQHLGGYLKRVVAGVKADPLGTASELYGQALAPFGTQERTAQAQVLSQRAGVTIPAITKEEAVKIGQALNDGKATPQQQYQILAGAVAGLHPTDPVSVATLRAMDASGNDFGQIARMIKWKQTGADGSDLASMALQGKAMPQDVGKMVESAYAGQLKKYLPERVTNDPAMMAMVEAKKGVIMAIYKTATINAGGAPDFKFTNSDALKYAMTSVLGLPIEYNGEQVPLPIWYKGDEATFSTLMRGRVSQALQKGAGLSKAQADALADEYKLIPVNLDNGVYQLYTGQSWVQDKNKQPIKVSAQ